MIARLAVVACVFSCASDAGDRFPCGTHGGSCAIGSQICVVGGSDACSTCIDAPAAYAENPSCESVPPASDEAFGDADCLDDGVCSDVQDGTVVTCAEPSWICG